MLSAVAVFDRRGTMRRIVLAACIIALLGNATVADAHVKRVTRTIDQPIHFGATNHATGFVQATSNFAKCAVGVRVDLWDVEDSPPTIEGTDYTDSNGRYVITDAELGRDFQAIAPRTRFGADGHHVCKRAGSTVSVDW
jgi:hypothetical protein